MCQSKTKICKFCNACKALYTVGRYRYWKTKLYYCTIADKIVNVKSSCANWHRKHVEYDLSAQRFDEVENDVRMLEKYMKDL